jgi:mannose-6-phosphate isomerase-like protein (cupin superfamily)
MGGHTSHFPKSPFAQGLSNGPATPSAHYPIQPVDSSLPRAAWVVSQFVQRTLMYNEPNQRASMSKSNRSRVISVAETQATIPPAEHAVIAFRRGPLDIALSFPVRPRRQTPHAQDEIYFIIRGRGWLIHDGKRDPFESGDLLFVAAGIEHQFEDISEDFAIWRVFYGPEGSEVPRIALGQGDVP